MSEFQPIRIVSDSYMSCSADGMGEQVWGEPVTRPDGKVLTIKISDGGRYVDVVVDNVVSGYNRKDIELLGEGDFENGLERLGKSAYRDPGENWRNGKPRLLKDEIKDLTTTKPYNPYPCKIDLTK